MSKGKIVQLDPTTIQRTDWISTRNSLVAELAKFKKVASDTDLEQAGSLQTKAAKHLKMLEEIRTEAKAPALAFGREIDSQAKVMRKTLEAEVARIKTLNSAYATELARKAEEERKRIQEEEAQKALERESAEAETFGGLVIERPEEAPRSLPDVKPKTDNNMFVEVWEHQIIDEKLIPDQFKVVDEKKIRAHVQYCKKMGMEPEIAGVRVIKRMDVRSKG